MSFKRSCILVLGMHRSGTSALTRTLNLLGASVPLSLMPASDDNEAGFWESSRLMEVNDALLDAAGSRWDDWLPFDAMRMPAGKLQEFEARLADVVKDEFGDVPLIVLKDPRISRFTPVYLQVLASMGFDVYCMHITRNPHEVAQSLARRDAMPPAKAALLWLRHGLDAELATRGQNRAFLTYDTLIEDARSTASRLADWLGAAGMAPDEAAFDKVAANIRPDLRNHAHSDGRLAGNDDNLSELLVDTYRALSDLEADPVLPDAQARLDACRDRLDNAADVTGAAVRALEVQLAEERQKLSAVEVQLAEERQKLSALEVQLAERERQLEAVRDSQEEMEGAFVKLRGELDRLALDSYENKMLRQRITKLLRSPLVSVGDNIRFRVAHRASRLLEKVAPKTSRKYARSAAKRDPKRFMVSVTLAQPQPVEVLKYSKDYIPGEGTTPLVIVPFEQRLIAHRPPVRLAVVLHLYHVDQAETFRKALSVIPVSFSLFISTDTDEKAAQLHAIFAGGPTGHIEIRVVPNRGRDIAPKLVTFAEIYDSQDLILFLHSEKSEHNLDILSGWRYFIMDALIGSAETAESILDAFAAAPDLGMVAPPNLPQIREFMDWNINFGDCRILAQRMGIALSVDSPLDFPSGSMFWARSAALRPLLEAEICLEDFPEEAGQTDGTFAHAVERMFFYSCEKAGFRWVHAGSMEHLAEQDRPLNVRDRKDLDWTISDQMPALLLPGLRPMTQPEMDPSVRLDRIKADFRAQCVDGLDRFLTSGATLCFPDPGTSPKLSIVLVLYNQAELTLHCLEALQRDAGTAIEIIIFDNGSSDDSGLLLERLEGVKIIRNDENLHFLRGVNRAALEATGEFLLLLNNDARVLPGTIPAAIARLEAEADIGAVGGPIVLLDGMLQEAGSIVFREGSCLGYGRGRDPGLAEFRFRRDVDYCSGAFLMMRRPLWEELGGFDTAFEPAYYEETDLCMRIWETGRRVVYDPRVKIVHFEFGSSKTSEAAFALQRRNRDIFVVKHAAMLKAHHLSITEPAIQARQRRDTAPRLLIIDDRMPLPSLGSGYPRAAEMLAAIGRAGWSATLYPCAIPYFSCTEAYFVIPETTELTLGEPLLPLSVFLKARVGCFDAVLVSRPHNMVRYREALADNPEWDSVPVIFDAEAIFARRDTELDVLRGRIRKADVYEQTQKALKREMALSHGVRTVLSVSRAEAETFRDHGCADVRVLGHALRPRPVGGGPEGRQDMLFVGALDDDKSPNTDSLEWFVQKIMPRIDALMGTDWCLNIAGRAGAPTIRKLESDRVRVLGTVEDLDPLYASARLFIAPTRYAAGIPMKLHESASVGLPAVATGLLADQLGWTNGVELLSADTAEDFAAACMRLYRDDALWSQLRGAGLAAIERDCAPETFGATIQAVLCDIAADISAR